MENNIGLITYHAAYNYGSVLQAYATQKAIEQIGYKAEIINYRMSEQKKYYSLYRPLKYGLNNSIKDILQFPFHNKRVNRINSFEDFIKNKLNISKELTEPSDVYHFWGKYNIIISGSDQIWNKNSLELKHIDWEYMYPYLLKGFSGKKISYASSFGTMKEEQINRLIHDISAFDHVSMREKSSSDLLSTLLKKGVTHVVDPTLLLSREEWLEEFGIKMDKKRDPYIFYYSLHGVENYKKDMQHLINLAKERDIKIKVLSPYAYYPIKSDYIELHPEYTIKDFLDSILNASTVYTRAYHGTVFSIIFNKEFWSLYDEGHPDIRREDLLKMVGLSNRLVFEYKDSDNHIDYSLVNRYIVSCRNKSYAYLEHSITT